MVVLISKFYGYQGGGDGGEEGKKECLITGYFTVAGPPINYLQNLCFDVCHFWLF